MGSSPELSFWQFEVLSVNVPLLLQEWPISSHEMLDIHQTLPSFSLRLISIKSTNKMALFNTIPASDMIPMVVMMISKSILTKAYPRMRTIVENKTDSVMMKGPVIMLN